MSRLDDDIAAVRPIIQPVANNDDVVFQQLLAKAQAATQTPAQWVGQAVSSPQQPAQPQQQAIQRRLATNPSGNAAVGLAQKAIGTPYQWGGNDLSKGVDCSGLVQQVYSRLGIHLPRTAMEQAHAGQIVPSHAAQPGDLVSFDENPNDANGTGADHIGIYAGNGMMVVAPHTGDHVKMQNINAIGAAPVFTRVPGHPAPVPGRMK